MKSFQFPWGHGSNNMEQYINLLGLSACCSWYVGPVARKNSRVERRQGHSNSAAVTWEVMCCDDIAWHKKMWSYFATFEAQEVQSLCSRVGLWSFVDKRQLWWFRTILECMYVIVSVSKLSKPRTRINTVDKKAGWIRDVVVALWPNYHFLSNLSFIVFSLGIPAWDAFGEPTLPRKGDRRSQRLWCEANKCLQQVPCLAHRCTMMTL